MRFLNSILFPTLCIGCQKPLLGDETCFCRHCLNKLPRTRFHLKTNNAAEQLFYGKCDIERCACFCYFQKGSFFREAIHHLKYHEVPKLAFHLGYLFAKELQQVAWEKPIDLLIPVPLHPFKKIQRGYNQSEWIARGIHECWKTPLRKDILKKVKHNDTQTQKGLFERYLNAIDTIQLQNNKILKDQHILLIDDVLTSGSTLEACSKAIHQFSNMKISILTLGFVE